LTRTGVVLDRVGVVATTCSTCGTVGIYVRSRLIGRVNLSTSSTHNRVVKLLPPFSARSGTVSVKVLTAGRPVVIDGLVTSHD
jgi:hypothetical protein